MEGRKVVVLPSRHSWSRPCPIQERGMARLCDSFPSRIRHPHTLFNPNASCLGKYTELQATPISFTTWWPVHLQKNVGFSPRWQDLVPVVLTSTLAVAVVPTASATAMLTALSSSGSFSSPSGCPSGRPDMTASCSHSPPWQYGVRCQLWSWHWCSDHSECGCSQPCGRVLDIQPPALKSTLAYKTTRRGFAPSSSTLIVPLTIMTTSPRCFTPFHLVEWIHQTAWMLLSWCIWHTFDSESGLHNT